MPRMELLSFIGQPTHPCQSYFYLPGARKGKVFRSPAAYLAKSGLNPLQETNIFNNKEGLYYKSSKHKSNSWLVGNLSGIHLEEYIFTSLSKRCTNINVVLLHGLHTIPHSAGS